MKSATTQIALTAASFAPLARPFLKWAGGKTQLLEQFEAFYPEELRKGLIHTYVEPFVGSGAVFFTIAQKYRIRAAYLSDVNDELILAYLAIQRAPETLIEALYALSKKYSRLSELKKEAFFYQVRETYNREKNKINFHKFNDTWLSRTAQMIFLNRTCYNGLYRSNRKGHFNVPFGRYANPRILDERNIRAVSNLLQIAEIRAADFEKCLNYVANSSFVYFDPPYRPISKTSSFTSYSKDSFDENEQIRLALFFARLSSEIKPKIMLSNSDPSNHSHHDDFFARNYRQFYIYSVNAKRMINCVGEKRGTIRELVITNYEAPR
jgi:DNA adenine methylase